jgi:hypothetical protein
MSDSNQNLHVPSANPFEARGAGGAVVHRGSNVRARRPLIPLLAEKEEV